MTIYWHFVRSLWDDFWHFSGTEILAKHSFKWLLCPLFELFAHAMLCIHCLNLTTLFAVISEMGTETTLHPNEFQSHRQASARLVTSSSPDNHCLLLFLVTLNLKVRYPIFTVVAVKARPALISYNVGKLSLEEPLRASVRAWRLCNRECPKGIAICSDQSVNLECLAIVLNKFVAQAG